MYARCVNYSGIIYKRKETPVQIWTVLEVSRRLKFINFKTVGR